MNFLYLTLSALIVCAHCLKKQTFIQFVRYEWKTMEFGFPTSQARHQAIANGNFNPTNAMPADVQPHYDRKKRLGTFLTIPKFQGGIPYSLALVSNRRRSDYSALLYPYPNLEMHDNKNGTNCDAITSAFRMAVTECNQMWVIDSGLVGSVAQCPPQLLLFDLNTDKLIHRYRFNRSLYIPGASMFITFVVNVRDPRDNCADTMVYVADVSYHGMVVYDYKQEKAWRIENMFMYPDPDYDLQYVAGERVILLGGIFGMATDKKHLYFHPIASRTEYTVPLSVIDNSTLFAKNNGNSWESFKALGERNGTCAASAMDSKNNMYCVTLNPIELIRWNVYTPYNERNIKKLPILPKQLEFVSGIKIIKNLEGDDDIWMLSNRLQKMEAGTQNFNEVNFRVVIRRLNDLDF